MTDRDTTTRTRARAPGAEGDPPSRRCAIEATGPTQSGTTEVTTRCTKGGCKPDVGQRMPGAGLADRGSGRCRLISQPSSRYGENPPYEMIGGIEETSHHSNPGPRLGPTRLSQVLKSDIITLIAQLQRRHHRERRLQVYARGRAMFPNQALAAQP